MNTDYATICGAASYLLLATALGTYWAVWVQRPVAAVVRWLRYVRIASFVLSAVAALIGICLALVR
jgi:hypothetical protein